MPPPRRIRPLRPCLQTRRPVDPARRPLHVASPCSRSSDANPRPRGTSAMSAMSALPPARGMRWWQALVRHSSTRRPAPPEQPRESEPPPPPASSPSDDLVLRELQQLRQELCRLKQSLIGPSSPSQPAISGPSQPPARGQPKKGYRVLNLPSRPTSELDPESPAGLYGQILAAEPEKNRFLIRRTVDGVASQVPLRQQDLGARISGDKKAPENARPAEAVNLLEKVKKEWPAKINFVLNGEKNLDRWAREIREAVEGTKTPEETNALGPAKSRKEMKAERVAKFQRAVTIFEKELEDRVILELEKATETKKLAEATEAAAVERAAEMERAAEAEREAEAEAERAAKARKAAEVKKELEARIALEAHKAAEAQKEFESRVAMEEARKSAEARLELGTRLALEVKKAAEAKEAANAKRAAEARKIAEAKKEVEARIALETARKADEARKDLEARLALEARKVEETRTEDNRRAAEDRRAAIEREARELKAKARIIQPHGVSGATQPHSIQNFHTKASRIEPTEPITRNVEKTVNTLEKTPEKTSQWPKRGVSEADQQPVQDLSTKISEMEPPTDETFDADPQQHIPKVHTEVNGKEFPRPTSPLRNTEATWEQTSDETPRWLSSSKLGDRSLLEELFPEAISKSNTRDPYPKLDLPENNTLNRSRYAEKAPTQRERITEAFQRNSESLTALQFIHCSTELTENDFRRLIPKGRHIESWVRDGEFHKVIPGRDPLTLERLPFYYLIFKSPTSALAYQRNVSRLHKLVGLHQSSSMFSAIPPPKGMLEEGEDLNSILASYVLKSTNLRLNLNMVMQPYNPQLRELIAEGGYKPIVPSLGSQGQPIWKVLVHIEGWESSAKELHFAFVRHAYERGLTWPFHNGVHGIHRLRDIVDLKAKFNPVSANNPRSANTILAGAPEQEEFMTDGEKAAASQIVMTRVYNRWIVELEDEDMARRFARMWNRRVLPTPGSAVRKVTDEDRFVNAEFMW